MMGVLRSLSHSLYSASTPTMGWLMAVPTIILFYRINSVKLIDGTPLARILQFIRSYRQRHSMPTLLSLPHSSRVPL
jgi:hypothetical protein